MLKHRTHGEVVAQDLQFTVMPAHDTVRRGQYELRMDHVAPYTLRPVPSSWYVADLK